MTSNINQLCKDPLFQINLAIWMAQPQSVLHFYIYPIFYESGLRIYSIGPLLALPPDIRLAVAKKINCQAAVRPDLILESQRNRRLCILECKASSFGPESSTASQARSFLLIANKILSEVLGLPTRAESKGMVCYLIGPDNAELMEGTLDALEKEIKEKVNCESGNYGCLKIRPFESSIILEYPEKIKKYMNLKKDSPIQIIEIKKDTDPRPLYFIPYDPNIQQRKEEQEYCRRVLFERILSYVLSSIGGSTIPGSITFLTDDLLNAATFGIFDIWEDNEAKKHIKRLVRDFIENIRASINESLRQCISYESQKGWIIDLKDKGIQDELLKQLQKYKPEELDLSKKIEPTLFENEEI